ncbi:hypothetical protein [Acidovorax sp. SUPP2825]|uniref:hypothetical protein n=1 Tax=Acidovorax sp. SUPP2825 TaxID=2920879 RepID=UPI0023DE53F4|nr:hypothetical protein [Acidovorax sp. SUPP2825]GKS97016.1 hypothetical protein AVAK2825_20795 [Acidovorax sp. SUPP2825]
MSLPISTLRASAPTTTDQLAQDAYHAYAKERMRLGGAKASEWERLSQTEINGWQQATSTIASHVAFTGCPRPLDMAGGVCEAKRCAEWLLHLSDGGDVGSDAQVRMLLRTAAGLLGSAADSPPPMTTPKTFDGLALASCPLSIEERAKWINVLDPLLKYAGRPGDWGRESKLGLLTQRLLQVRQELTQGELKEGGAA